MIGRLFELVAERERAVKEASLQKESFLGALAKYVLKNPMKSAFGALDALNVADSAKKTENIANQVAQNVARAPRNVGPTM